MIHSKLYYFKPQPNFNGRRIELIKANNVTATCRFHFQFIKEVDLFAPEFNDEAFWARVEANQEAVKAFLAMLETDISEPPAEQEPDETDGDGEGDEDSETEDSDSTSDDKTGDDKVDSTEPEVTT